MEPFSFNPERTTMDTTRKSENRIAVLLDRSGSMSNYKGDAVAGINSYLDQLGADGETAAAKFSLFLFDSSGFDRIRSDVAIVDCPRMCENEFVPRHMTPLLDAIGRTASILEEAFQPGDRQILAILTDGFENASRQYSNEDIAALLQRKQDESWIIVYLGANQDSWRAARQWGVSRDGVADFDIKAMSGTAYALYSASARAFGPDKKMRFTDDEREMMLGRKERNSTDDK